MSKFSKKFTEEELKSKLSPLEYKVTQEEATEPPFNNKYWDNHEEGLYVDIITGEPLFTSKDKFDSGTGWPCFSQPIDKKTLNLKDDFKMVRARTEVRTKLSDAHLGHVFDDGPEELGGARYCINSAALKFIALADLKKDPTYKEWLSLFEED